MDHEGALRVGCHAEERTARQPRLSAVPASSEPHGGARVETYEAPVGQCHGRRFRAPDNELRAGQLATHSFATADPDAEADGGDRGSRGPRPVLSAAESAREATSLVTTSERFAATHDRLHRRWRRDPCIGYCLRGLPDRRHILELPIVLSRLGPPLGESAFLDRLGFAADHPDDEFVHSIHLIAARFHERPCEGSVEPLESKSAAPRCSSAV